MTSPSLTSPVTYTKTWVDVFTDLDQWEDSVRFYSVHARDLNTVRGFRRLCSPTIGHLVALRGGGVQLVHNIHDGAQDDLDTDRGGTLGSHRCRRYSGHDGHRSDRGVRQSDGYRDRMGYYEKLDDGIRPGRA